MTLGAMVQVLPYEEEHEGDREGDGEYELCPVVLVAAWVAATSLKLRVMQKKKEWASFSPLFF